MTKTPTTNRNRNNGQYTYSADFSRLCRCGHSLGVHTGEAPHECLNGDQYLDGATGEPCACVKFRKAPAPK